MLSDLRLRRTADARTTWLAWTRTIDHQRLLDRSVSMLETWLEKRTRPRVSIGGGKDSTLTLLLARDICPTIEAVCADPPNPLSDRAEHIEQLMRDIGGPWKSIDYSWDVEAVLAGRAAYPHMLKVKRLISDMKQDSVDGVILGVRGAESHSRMIHVNTRGLAYRRKDGLHVCQPIAYWSAEHVLGELLRRDAPLNPVYSKLSSAPDSMEHVRDGTWWPVVSAGQNLAIQRGWIATHYPEHLDDFDLAIKSASCHVEW